MEIQYSIYDNETLIYSIFYFDSNKDSYLESLLNDNDTINIFSEYLLNVDYIKEYLDYYSKDIFKTKLSLKKTIYCEIITFD